MKLKVARFEGFTVGLASENAREDIIGISQPLLLKLSDEQKTPIIIQPLILRNLAHPINISGKSLKSWEVLIDHGKAEMYIPNFKHPVKLFDSISTQHLNAMKILD